MLEDLKAADEEQLLLLEEEFRELISKESELLEELTHVRTAKQRVRRLVAEKKNRYAPIFTLPDELLVSIVEAAQQSSDPTNSLVEVTASHVSQRFRCAVIGASPLWSSIELRWGVKSDEERFAVYLQRSRTCFLSVELKYDTYYGTEECDYDDVRNELATVAQNSIRLRRLVIHCGGLGLTLLDALKHFHSLYAPCLQHFDISSHEYESDLDDWGDLNLSIFEGGAPCLTTLRLNSVWPSLTSENPWVSGLTSLDLRGMRTPDGRHSYTLKILAICSQLIHLTLDDSTVFFGPPADISVRLPSLRSLRGFCLNDRSDWPATLIANVLLYIDGPALEVLEFCGGHIHGSHITSFFNLLQPSKFPILKSLTFASPTVVCDVCEWRPLEHVKPQALRHLPSLELLTMINMCNTNALLTDLLAPLTDANGTPSRALSSLRSLTLRYKDSDDLGISNWPKLKSDNADPDEAVTLGLEDVLDLWTADPLEGLQTLLAPVRDLRPIHLRLPRSRFFTENDWIPDDPNFEIFDVQPLLRSLEISEPERSEIE
ncbi:hypothetical protein MVEN_01773400 [Mycena venus]|uniref:F-box domain-containing protein n=1 Tax=Mycena venus TaxID=2733690 RepID=A0A8H6XKP6_9AGAR|nr:hypothetical protein MVEN_01773400 [Mycena venus]